MGDEQELDELGKVIMEALGEKLKPSTKSFIMPVSSTGAKLLVRHELMPQLLELITKNKKATDRNPYAFMLGLVAKREGLDNNRVEWELPEKVDNVEDNTIWITFREWLQEAGFTLPKMIDLN